MSTRPKTTPEALAIDPRCLPELRELNARSPRALNLLMVLLEESGTPGEVIVASYKTLMEVLGVSRATVGRAVQTLKDGGWVTSVQNGASVGYVVSEKVLGDAEDVSGSRSTPKILGTRWTKKTDYGRPAMTKVETSLYRHYDAEGRLLYIGISLSAFTRFAQHKHGSVWSANVARMEIEHYASREAALRAERRAIQAEQPVWNVQHAPPIHE